jgi:hypothetical protein
VIILGILIWVTAIALVALGIGKAISLADRKSIVDQQIELMELQFQVYGGEL